MSRPSAAPMALALPQLPLALPDALWREMSEDERAVYRGAQSILEGLQVMPEHAEFSFDEGEGADPEMLFGALHLLETMGLVRVDAEGSELGVTLLALPEEHIRITAPDRTDRWVFVSRPLEEPEWNEFDLN